MNYIVLIKKFWFLQNYHSLSVTDIALYFYLLEVNNVCLWSNTFNRNNKRIEADLNISFNTLAVARNKLKQVGLIDFETKNGSPNVKYTLSNFDKVADKVTDKVTDELASEVVDEVLNEVVEKVADELTDEIIKQKQEKEKTKLFIPPDIEEVKEYCKERKNEIDPQKFLDFYQSKGWMVGKNKMKDWKACVRTWENNGNKIKEKKHPAINYQTSKNKVDERF